MKVQPGCQGGGQIRSRNPPP